MKKLLYLSALSLSLFSCNSDNDTDTIAEKHLVKKIEYLKMVDTDDIVLNNIAYYIDDNTIIDSIFNTTGTYGGKNITLKTPEQTTISNYAPDGTIYNERYFYYDSQGRLTGRSSLYNLIDIHYTYNNDSTITTSFMNQDTGEAGVIKTDYIGNNGLIYKSISLYPGPEQQTSTLTYDGQKPITANNDGTLVRTFAYYQTEKPETLKQSAVETNNALLNGFGQSPYYADYYYKQPFAVGGYYEIQLDDDGYLMQEVYYSPGTTGNPSKSKTVYFYE